MPYNYSKLLGKIIEKCGNQYTFANKVGLSERSVSLKLSGKREWKQNEMQKVCEVLEIPLNEVSQYFFTLNVQ